MARVYESVDTLKLRAVIDGFKSEPFALLALCGYFFFEYLRPQQMYPIFDFIPWGLVSLALCFASVVMMRRQSIEVGTMDHLFILFTLWVMLSVVFAYNPGASLDRWTTYTSWVVMYYCVVNVLTTPRRLLLFLIFFLLINFKFSQFGARVFASRGFSFAGWGLSGSGWFHNSGELSMQMVVMFSLSWCLLTNLREYVTNPRRWKVLWVLFPGTALLTVLGASSRGGQIALAAVIVAGSFRFKRFWAGVVILAMLVGIAWKFLPPEQIERFTTMGDDQTSEIRMEYWEYSLTVVERNPLTGIGYWNWNSYVQADDYASELRSEHGNPNQVYATHNTVLEAFVELGYPGGTLFLILVCASVVLNFKSRRDAVFIGGSDGAMLSAFAMGLNLAMLGSFIASIFMSVLYYPGFWVAFALTSAVRRVAIVEARKTARNRDADAPLEDNLGSAQVST